MESAQHLYEEWSEGQALIRCFQLSFVRREGNVKKLVQVHGLILLILLGSDVFAHGFDKPDPLAPIAEFTQSEIQAGRVPGAVVLVGNSKVILYRKAFGQRALEPAPLPMNVDTRFDLASLTKVVATTTAIMQLVEQKKIRLDAPVVKYWPQFAKNQKKAITIRQLLTHYSGLRADLDLSPKWSGYRTALRLIVAEKPISAPGVNYLYSDINFEILGELVRRVSGEPLDVYCAKHIFRPLGMKNTGFNPIPSHRHDIAPTEYLNGKLRWGEVHDPTAYDMRGVAGHAGLFSTADDLAIFAKMLLNGGREHGVRILSRHSVEEMTIPQSPPGKARLRGLGWNLASPFAPNRDQLLPVGSYGHRGFTGTLLWIDPVSKIYVIVLSNRVHPYGKGNAGPLRKGILAIVADAQKPESDEQILAARPALASYYKLATVHPEIRSAAKVATGIDVLEAEDFAPLKGLRIGVITNQTGIDAAGNRTVDMLYRAPGVKLAAIFSPEHGISGNMDGKVASGMDASTGLPVYSLYGNIRRPTDDMLKQLDALVFDIQDVGARFYTYDTTLAYAMEAAARKGIDFYVLDRPDPISADVVQGPMLDADMTSFTAFYPLPVRHGMTIGELAGLFNIQAGINVKLHVIKMRGYRRNDWFDDTGLKWISPSPNLRSLTEATLYPGIGLVEGANVSVGRGTDTPFELIGAPWINGKGLANYLNRRNIAGVFFIPSDFTPNANRYQDQLCHGIRIIVTDRHALDSPLLGIEVASALYRLYPAEFHTQKILGMVGAHWVLQAIADGMDPKMILSQEQDQIEKFNALRNKYLLY
ncbi:MAG TPA: exo-beta-N-acetylmuramidase NamZ domain-containing protein [Halothiobacillus sp.]|nr:exo-beta-N-acetylmuramidase NamZ domain-containing protein [Halothiobacillus sp.]